MINGIQIHGWIQLQLNKQVDLVTYLYVFSIQRDNCLGRVNIGRVHMSQIVANSLMIDEFDTFCGFG